MKGAPAGTRRTPTGTCVLQLDGLHAARDFLATQPQPVLEKPLDTTALKATIARLRGTPVEPARGDSLAALAAQLPPSD